MTDLLAPLSLVRDPARFGGTPQGDCLRGQPVFDKRRLVALAPPDGGAAQIILPALTEAHCHLDKCHTAHRIDGIGGDLAHALDLMRADKATWTEDDLRARMTRGLAEARTGGCAHIRSHIDWGDEAKPPAAWHIVSELAQDHPGLHGAALTAPDQWADPAFANTAGRAIAASGGAAGAFLPGAPEDDTGLRAMFATADQLGLPLDFHVDEGLGDWNGLEAIADIAIETGFQGPILCGHAVSLIDRHGDTLTRILDKLARARITICALPPTNLYLQGRRDGTPDRRGLTRLQELRAHGIPIVIGSDNVADVFCPVGAHDPMLALHIGTMAAHLDPPMGQWLPAITTDAASAIGADPTFIDGTALNDLRLCAVTNTNDLVAGRAPLRLATELT